MLQVSAESMDGVADYLLCRTKVPGLALAVVTGERVLFAKGYGYRDLDARLPMTTDTSYPIASTTKGINATLLGILTERSQLAWDAPVRLYLPRFRLQDRLASDAATLRDLVAMRTGLPRHDLVWLENVATRGELIAALEHLAPSAGFRERFQYNNLTVTAAAHVAEIVTGRSWEELVQENILQPLSMRSTCFNRPESGNVAASYQEDSQRRLTRYRYLDTHLIAPAGGTIHSTISDMARWVSFNLNAGAIDGQRLLRRETLSELHAPCVVMRGDPAAPSFLAAYGLGWAVDTYKQWTRVSHGGDLHNVNSCITLFPELNLGIVSFVNMGVWRFARAINQCVFDRIMGITAGEEMQTAIDGYEQRVEQNIQRRARLRRTSGTAHSHSLSEYAGVFTHGGYGSITIACEADALILVRHKLRVRLEHWHYNSWVIDDDEVFQYYRSHPLERSNRITFEVDADGHVVAFNMQPEQSVAAVRFMKRGGGN